MRLIDFEKFDQNTFHVVTELTYKNGEDEFRPDITLLINGMPLVFIEVKNLTTEMVSLSNINVFKVVLVIRNLEILQT